MKISLSLKLAPICLKESFIGGLLEKAPQLTLHSSFDPSVYMFCLLVFEKKSKRALFLRRNVDASAKPGA